MQLEANPLLKLIFLAMFILCFSLFTFALETCEEAIVVVQRQRGGIPTRAKICANLHHHQARGAGAKE